MFFHNNTLTIICQYPRSRIFSKFQNDLSLQRERYLNILKYLGYIAVMAVVTYLVRMLPITLFQKEIKNIYIKSFLYYVPYAVLSAMTFPAIFFVSQSIVVSTIATLVALILAYRGKSLLTVALVACVVLWFCDFIM